VSAGITRVSVRILDKEYQVACPAEERDDLMRCAKLLNERMREIRDSGKIIGLERIAVMAALNITHELIRTDRADDKLDDTLSERLRRMRLQVETALDRGQQLEL
jgi:cell division protein ZapA